MSPPQTFTKVDVTPRRHHGYAVLLFIFGTLFPPLAVAARFGIGGDFWLNLLLTICGYIPGHVHNFYIQNIRNNKTHRRTPKWVLKYGLVNNAEIKRKERKSQWANRYSERNPHSALREQSLEEGQEGGSSVDLSLEEERQRGGELWNPNEERFYGKNGDRSSAILRTNDTDGGRWHYPANFEDTVAEPTRKKTKKRKDKKDRWTRTDDAYSVNDAEASMKRKKSKKRRSTVDSDAYSRQSDTTSGFPEDAEGGLYGSGRDAATSAGEETNGRTNEEYIFNHEL
ncbi:uncharacterized protein PHACADRAFT_256162 [Phanerochaete carnosa HHB-10118-sp]|uniref:Stress response RCI peptide n=1 Tax=Phanerochaete carnosa (strain HHB-10118-sp) TaxID=650164 RepID=K5W8I9_PHACS|nr:uncharacterized protein PHACADRAFT_256162 [Phanerochaete carnosa HHB-10118-sp]EKM55500.1 hypothetical protein PHACADRAFT_256162 [Phanerochaete carnosa HHB-10118-sp]